MFFKSSTTAATAILALPFLAHSALAVGACTRQYTVQAGDICNSISAAKNVSTYQLAVVNHGIIDSACSNLQIGQNLCLGHENQDCSTTYVVQPDDTCSQIAANHNLNTTVLNLNNPQIDEECSNIYIGEVLCVAGAVQVPPAPAGTVPSDLPGASIPPGATPANPNVQPPAGPKTDGAAPPAHDSTPAKPPPPSNPPAGDEQDDEENLPYCDEL